MTSDQYSRPPYSFLAPPGVVEVSGSALRMARNFAADIHASASMRYYIVSFDWADSRSVRRPPGGPMVELGPGLDLAAYDPADIPDGVMQTVDDFSFAVKIPGHIYARSQLRLIDTDTASPSGLVLR